MNPVLSPHPISFYQLDRYVAADEPQDPQLEAHLAVCTRCRAHVAELSALASLAPPVWTGTSQLPRTTAWAHFRSRGPLLTGGAVALAASALLFWRLAVPRATDDTDYVGVKGTPAVQAIVRHAGHTALWDNKSPVHPGDAIALRIDCQDYRFVTLATEGPAPTRWRKLADTPCTEGPFVLPYSLVVDAAPGQERIAVVLSRQPLTEQNLGAISGTTGRSDATWIVTLVFPKADQH